MKHIICIYKLSKKQKNTNNKNKKKKKANKFKTHKKLPTLFNFMWNFLVNFYIFLLNFISRISRKKSRIRNSQKTDSRKISQASVHLLAKKFVSFS